MINSEWLKLRTFNGSQQNAFEELICQLAANETIINSKQFVRVGSPDGGVECYWLMKNNDIVAWQSKFFQSLGASQWKQIEDSFRTAFKKHSTLKKYVVCTPIDRNDPHLKNRKSMMDKWKQNTTKWSQFALKKGRNIKFEYWGNHEIFQRLTNPKNVGKSYFWFDENEFTDQWFNEKLENSISELGPRYSSELNFELDVAKIFNGLARDDDFKKEFYDSFNKLLIKFNKALNDLDIEETSKEKEIIVSEFQNVKNDINRICFESMEVINFEKLYNICTKLDNQVYELSHKLEDLSKIDKEQKREKDKSTNYIPDKFSGNIHYLREFGSELRHFGNAIIKVKYKLSNIPCLILTGEAGIGKSHLLADVALNRKEKNLPSVLLLGQHFRNSDPKKQILQILDLRGTFSEFLGALDSKAQTLGSRIIFFIDAINEGEGKIFWKDFIVSFIKTYLKYKNLALVLSIRSSYEKLLAPTETVDEKIAIRHKHIGFAKVTDKATIYFFDYYNINLPETPILYPEFNNPLFLKLLCKGIHKSGKTSLPEGFEGITTIFNFYVNVVNQNLSNRLIFPNSINIVEKAVDEFSKKLVETGKRSLNYENSFEIINSVTSPYIGTNSQILEELISEGIFTKNLSWNDSKEHEEVVYFGYERFGDHKITNFLLNNYLNKKNPRSSFNKGKKLYEYIKDNNSTFFNQGIIEALSIQLPEVVSKELYEVAPHASSYCGVRRGFINSLIWRKYDTISDKLKKYINENIIINDETNDLFWDTIILISGNPNHYFNADFIHKHLMRFSLAERDFHWSIYIHNQYNYDDYNAVKRIVDWAWSTTSKEYISQESIRLISKTLSWFLTTSNRFLRDAATKALVSILSNNISVLINVLKDFANVNDPYVTERLYAVAYGCAMRSDNHQLIIELAQYVYDELFKKGNPPVQVLTRDFARGVIEYAIFLKLDVKVNLTKIRPPYNSKWPKRIPSEKSLKKYCLDYQSKDFKDSDRAQNDLYHSVMGFEDFSRYIIGTNSKSSEFSVINFRDKEIFKHFKNQLSPKKKNELKKYEDIINLMIILKSNSARVFDEEKKKEINLIYGKLYKLLNSRKPSLRKIFSKSEYLIFRNTVRHYLLSTISDNVYPNKYFDLKIVQRLILQRVFELGWTKERFAQFDFILDKYKNRGRESHKEERIGKKYQWIAYHEIIARLTDNFEFLGNYSDEKRTYQGPWQRWYRDIDPSILIKNVKGDENGNPSWAAANIDYESWPEGYNEWVKEKNNLPDAKKSIEISDSNEIKWLAFDLHLNWEESTKEGYERFDLPHKALWYQVRGYIIRKSMRKKILSWAKKQNFMGRWMTESGETDNIFYREFYWSQAYKNYLNNSSEKWNWTNIDGFRFGNEKGSGYKCINPVCEFTWSRGYDCSIEESVRMCTPCIEIFRFMNLKFGDKEGEFVNETGDVVCFDPSVYEKGNSCLLIRKDYFLKFLKENNLDVLWTLLGEKLQYANHHNREPRLEISGVYHFQNDELISNLSYRVR